jgi:hypothetical protein
MKCSNENWHEQQFGTPSLATEQEGVRDAYVAHLEAALRKIASGVDPGFGTLSGAMCADIAREALALGDVERIPDGVKFPPRGEVAFMRWPVPGGDWHLIGPAVLLEPGTVIEVRRFSERDSALTAVGRIVAERTVIHRKEGPVQYVVARVARAVRD